MPWFLLHCWFLCHRKKRSYIYDFLCRYKLFLSIAYSFCVAPSMLKHTSPKIGPCHLRVLGSISVGLDTLSPRFWAIILKAFDDFHLKSLSPAITLTQYLTLKRIVLFCWFSLTLYPSSYFLQFLSFQISKKIRNNIKV